MRKLRLIRFSIPKGFPHDSLIDMAGIKALRFIYLSSLRINCDYHRFLCIMLVEEHHGHFTSGGHFFGRDISGDGDVLQVDSETAGDLNGGGVIGGIKVL